MRAHVGDRLRVKGHHVGEPERVATVVEVRGPDGTPPFLVRWGDSDHDTLFYPGSDAVIEEMGPVG
jgi:hypothetical protein